MSVLQILCLMMPWLCTIQANPALLGSLQPRGSSAVPGCVTQAQDRIDGDIPLTRLHYMSVAKKETDTESAHAQFLTHALRRVRGGEHKPLDDDMYVTFAVYYRHDKGDYKQAASAIICTKQFGSKENRCRNRSYLFSVYLDPIRLADVLVEDISSAEPTFGRCAWTRSRRAPSASRRLSRQQDGVKREAQFQVSQPVLNPADGLFYQRTRWVYDSDGDGILESHDETIHSSDSPTDMLDQATSLLRSPSQRS